MPTTIVLSENLKNHQQWWAIFTPALNDSSELPPRDQDGVRVGRGRHRGEENDGGAAALRLRGLRARPQLRSIHDLNSINEICCFSFSAIFILDTNHALVLQSEKVRTISICVIYFQGH